MSNENKLNINWYPGHMAKTKRQIIEDLKLIDVVIELLDSRIPISSRNPDIAEITKNKKRIILLNKCDLSDEKTNQKWVDKFSKEAPTLLTDANSGRGIDKVTKKIDEIMEEEKQRQAARGRVSKTIRVMILGIPNVGKSSFINRMINKKSAVVGNRPGVTKQKQWVRISSNIELLDTPGVLWPKFESEDVALKLAYTGTIKDELLQRTDIAYSLLDYLIKNYKEELKLRYKLTDEDFDSIIDKREVTLEIMNIIARKRGAIVSGGEIDYEKVAVMILNDFRTAKIGRITLEKVNEG